MELEFLEHPIEVGHELDRSDIKKLKKKMRRGRSIKQYRKIIKRVERRGENGEREEYLHVGKYIFLVKGSDKYVTIKVP